MIWREHGKTENLPTPSSYSADIEDTDNDRIKYEHFQNKMEVFF